MCSHRKDHRQISYHDRWIYYELSAFVCMCMCMACIIITLLRFYHILMLPFISFINLCWWWWRPGYVPMQFLDLMAWTGPGLASGIKIYLRYIFAYCLAGKPNQKETDVPGLCAIVVRGQSGKPRPPMFIKMFHAVMYRGYLQRSFARATCLDEEVTLGKTLVAGGPHRRRVLWGPSSPCRGCANWPPNSS